MGAAAHLALGDLDAEELRHGARDWVGAVGGVGVAAPGVDGARFVAVWRSALPAAERRLPLARSVGASGRAVVDLLPRSVQHILSS
jgi:hypothetical protein